MHLRKILAVQEIEMQSGEASCRGPDRFLRLTIRIGRMSLPAFQVCGYTGLALAVVLAMALVLRRGLSPWAMAGVVLSAVASFLALAMAMKIVTGREKLVYYYHELAAVAFAAGFLWLARQPVLPYLDATILGIGLFLACGRVGCLMVGCCHGRPSRWGVCYGHEHAAAGFTPYYVGMRLFPVQAAESLWVLAVVAVGSYLAWSGAPAGAALDWYVVAYGVGRFCFEFLRGDPERPYWRGFSEAQWLTVLMIGLTAGAELTGLLPLQAWHCAVAAGLPLAMIVIALERARDGVRYRLLQPRHVREVAAALEQSFAQNSAPGAPVAVGRTSLGIQISAGVVREGSGSVVHYALSQTAGRMGDETANVLQDLIVQLRHPGGAIQVLKGREGVVHLLVREEG